MGTNKNREGDLNVASSSFFPLKDSVVGRFILHCHWAAELGQLKSQDSSSLSSSVRWPTGQEPEQHKGQPSPPEP